MARGRQPPPVALNDEQREQFTSFVQSTSTPFGLMQRVFCLFGVMPHPSEIFRLSSDPFLIGKVHDITDLYLYSPDSAMVLCVGGRSRIQALDRTRPALPLEPGHVEGYTHKDVRHGTTTLFATLDGANGKLIGNCSIRHRHQEFPAFPRPVDRETPPDPDIHPVMDSHATHRHPRVRAWIAKKPRHHLQFTSTPTSTSSLNQVGRWLGFISQRAIRRGSFDSMRQTIDAFIERHNASTSAFVWVATAESIFARLERLSARICGTQH